MLHFTVSNVFPLVMADPENRHLRSPPYVHKEQVLIQTDFGYFHNKENRKDESETNEDGNFWKKWDFS